MELHKETRDDVLFIHVQESKIDSSVAPEFKKELLAAAVQESPNIVIDIANVDYMDSSGLGTLLFGHRQSQQNGGSFVIIKPNSKIQKLINIAQLSRVLHLCDSEAEALALIQGGGGNSGRN